MTKSKDRSRGLEEINSAGNILQNNFNWIISNALASTSWYRAISCKRNKEKKSDNLPVLCNSRAPTWEFSLQIPFIFYERVMIVILWDNLQQEIRWLVVNYVEFHCSNFARITIVSCFITSFFFRHSKPCLSHDLTAPVNIMSAAELSYLHVRSL
jgi:hypothetical protein